MHVIKIAHLAVSAHEVSSSWSPDTSLYERTEFHLRSPDTVDLRAVSEGMWWRIALICLHSLIGLGRRNRVRSLAAHSST